MTSLPTDPQSWDNHKKPLLQKQQKKLITFAIALRNKSFDV